jgi:iron complex transport system substrate-binding protein
MKSTRLIFTLLAATSLLLVSACGTSKVPAGPVATRTVADDLGRKVTVPAKLTRAISLAPNITEIVFALGAGDKLVGVTTFCNYPAEATKIRKVGDTLKPNIESIVALRPQVVLASTASQLEAFTGLLEKQGVEVFVTKPNSIEDVFSSIEKIGDVLGNKKQAGELTGELKTRVEAVRKNAEGKAKKRVFIQIDRSLYTVGSESYITDLVAIAGGESVTSDIATAYPKISRETAKALDPDVIILSDSPDNESPNEALEGSKAVREGRVYKIDADILSRPGPRIVDALELIFNALHGGDR